MQYHLKLLILVFVVFVIVGMVVVVIMVVVHRRHGRKVHDNRSATQTDRDRFGMIGRTIRMG